MRLEKAESPNMLDASLFLVSCVGRKCAKPVHARDLYTSAWFRKARCCVERTRRPWWILSAEYGLVHPGTVLAPYEKTLNRMGFRDRLAWARGVLSDLIPQIDEVESVCFLAGQRYREHLEPALRERGINVIVPMAGMGIGKQLQWLGRCCNG